MQGHYTLQNNNSATQNMMKGSSSHQHHHQHHRRKIRKPSKAYFVEADSDSENEKVDVFMATDSQIKKSSIVDYEKKIEVINVLFPDLGLSELKNLFEDFKEDIQAVVEFLLAKKRAGHGEHQLLSSPKPNNTCHRIETLINKKNHISFHD